VSVISGGPPEHTVDVGSWVRLVIGPDGGEGTRAICAPLDARPWRSGVTPHGKAIVDVKVDLLFPDNEVKGARVDVIARRESDPSAAETALSVGAGRYMELLWKALRSLDGVTSASSVTVRVHCTIDGGSDVLGAPPPEKLDAGPKPEKPAS
jgi:hypothetical protein